MQRVAQRIARVTVVVRRAGQGRGDEDAAVDQRHVAAYRSLRAEIRVAQRAADAQAVKLDSLGIFQSVRAPRVVARARVGSVDIDLGRLGVEAQAVEAKVEIVVAPFQRQSKLTGALRLSVGQAYIGGEIEDR